MPIHLATHRWVSPARIAVTGAIVSAVLLARPVHARAAGADCAPVQAAIALLYKTPFHVIITKTATKTGAFPTTADEAIWAGTKLYMKLSGNRWLATSVPPDDVLASVTKRVVNYRECRRLPDDAIRGDATAVYAAKLESGEPVQLWISAKSGLPLRDVVDEDIMKVTAEFDFANVRPPVTP